MWIATPALSTSIVEHCRSSPSRESSALCRNTLWRTMKGGDEFPRHGGDAAIWSLEGPNGSQHVATYLGRGQILESPFAS